MARPISPAEARAIKKAQALGGPDQVTRIAFGIYTVPSASGQDVVYTITGIELDGSDATCTCIAAEQGRPQCWHRASVRLRRIQETALAEYRKLQARRRTPETVAA